MHFIRYEECDGVAMVLHSGNCCCGENLSMGINVEDADQQKHLPLVTRKGTRLKVDVGALNHEMEKGHQIEWICVETDKGAMVHRLSVGEKPQSEFELGDEKALAVYACCTKHGIWGIKKDGSFEE